MLRPWSFIRETRPPWRALPDPLPGTIGYDDGRPIIRLSATRPARIVDGPAFSLCHTHGYNYGHWLADCLPALLDVTDLAAAGRLSVLLPPTTAWQRRTLELLGVPPSAVVEVGHATVAVADLVCNSYGGSSHIAYPGPLLVEVFRRLGSAASPADVTRPRLVFVGRRQSGYPREFLDEVQLEDSLRGLGFVPLHPEAMTVDEQVAAFSHAEVVVGPHGSALMNAAFAPRGCLVVDIIPEHLRPRAIYEMTRLMGHRLIVQYASQWTPDGAKAPSGAIAPTAAVRFSLDAVEIVERVRAGMERLGIAPG